MNKNLSMDKTGTINSEKKIKYINQSTKNKIRNNNMNNNDKININTFCYNKKLNETNNVNNMKSIDVVKLPSIYNSNKKNERAKVKTIPRQNSVSNLNQ